jgi:hypothetical protein
MTSDRLTYCRLTHARFDEFYIGPRRSPPEPSRSHILVRQRSGFDAIVAGVDEPNVASLKVLEKLGFRRVSTHKGSFGSGFLMVLEPPVREIEENRPSTRGNLCENPACGRGSKTSPSRSGSGAPSRWGPTE